MTSASYDESNTINSLHSLMIEPTIGCTRGLYGLQYTRRHTFSHDGLCEELVDVTIFHIIWNLSPCSYLIEHRQ